MNFELRRLSDKITTDALKPKIPGSTGIDLFAIGGGEFGSAGL